LTNNNERKDLLTMVGEQIFALIVALGADALAGGRIAYVVLLAFFVLTAQLGTGIQILVGQSLGRSAIEDARYEWLRGQTFLILLLSAMGIILGLWPETLAALFTSSAEVQAQAAQALTVVAVTFVNGGLIPGQRGGVKAGQWG
jgi:Na+-driven multidrug efflux pump